MSRSDFKTIRNVAVSRILLDQQNARIRAGQDQADCIQRILRKEDQLIALAEDVAKNGLSTIPILVTPALRREYVVRDGNRRITALKLLNDPDRWSPDARLRQKFLALRKTYAANIPSAVEVLCTTNEEALVREVIARHSGANGGVGQLDWSAYLRTVYLVTHQIPAEYKRPGQYAFWAEDHGINVGDDFPISNLQRFFTKDNLARLGFDVDSNDELAVNTRLDVVKKMAATVLGDFEASRVRVADVFKPVDASAYISRVREMHGIVEPDSKQAQPGTDSSTPTAPPNADDPTGFESPDGPGRGASGLGPGGEQPPTPTPSPPPAPAPSPKTSPSDRRQIFGGKAPGIAIPADQKKAATILTELRKLDLDKTPFAASMLLRALIEISDEYYRKGQKIDKKKSLANDVAASADSMHNRGLLTSSQLDIVKRHTGASPDSLVHIETLQRMLHRDTHHSSKQFVNTMWDNIGCFIQACWRQEIAAS